MDQGFCLPEDILEDVEGSHHNLLGVGDIHHNPLVGEAVPERKINEIRNKNRNSCFTTTLTPFTLLEHGVTLLGDIEVKRSLKTKVIAFDEMKPNRSINPTWEGVMQQ